MNDKWFIKVEGLVYEHCDTEKRLQISIAVCEGSVKGTWTAVKFYRTSVRKPLFGSWKKAALKAEKSLTDEACRYICNKIDNAIITDRLYDSLDTH